MESIEGYINRMIKEGYCSKKDLEPIKCHHCKSTNLKNRNHEHENMSCIAYEKWCNDCGKKVNSWNYGAWEI